MSGSETLVKRLRCNAREEMSLVDMLPTGPLRSLGEQKSKLCEEAAARIEELEALLGKANDMLDSGASISRGERVDLMDEIEAALAAKDNAQR